jgi:hypothetical protein
MEIVEPKDNTEIEGRFDIVVKTSTPGLSKCDSVVCFMQGIRIGKLQALDNKRENWSNVGYATVPPGTYSLCMKAYNRWFETTDSVIVYVTRACSVFADIQISPSTAEWYILSRSLEWTHSYDIVLWGHSEYLIWTKDLLFGKFNWEAGDRWYTCNHYERVFLTIGDVVRVEVDSSGNYDFGWYPPRDGYVRFLIFDILPKEKL